MCAVFVERCVVDHCLHVSLCKLGLVPCHLALTIDFETRSISSKFTTVLTCRFCSSGKQVAAAGEVHEHHLLQYDLNESLPGSR